MQQPIGKKRKMLLILAVFIVSVVCATWWWVIHERNQAKAEKTKLQKQQAFNTRLPDANPKQAGKNKLEIYMEAQKDSAKQRELLEKDSADKRWFDPGPPEDDVFADEYPPQLKKKVTAIQATDPNEKKVNERLEKLYAALNTAEPSVKQQELFPDQNSNLPAETDVAKLENLLMSMRKDDSVPDPEIKQLETLMDKVLDIQYPERVKEKYAGKSTDLLPNNLMISTTQLNDTNYRLNDNADNGFYGLQEISDPAIEGNNNSILAVIHDEQKIQAGQNLKFRLLQNIFINNNIIPKDFFVFGKCEIAEGRVNVTIQSISYNGIIYPAHLTVYDYTDGMEGINVQGDITEEVTKSGMEQLTQQMQLNALNPTLATQAATTGIQTAQNLLRKKIKRIQVTMKAGHKVILKLKSNT